MQTNVFNPIKRMMVAKELIVIETKRRNREDINQARLAVLYVQLLDEELIEAIKVLSNKEVCGIISITARVERKFAQQAIQSLKRKQVKKCEL